jgi:ribosomal protein L2
MYPIKAHNHRSRLGEYMFSVFLKFGIKVSMVYLNNYSTAYTASSGNYLVFLGFFKKKNLSLFRLPSSRKTFFPSLSICLVGRHVGLFMKYRVFGSFKFYNLKKKKRFSTRGVAMNPVDHHNGGRSKTKSPFFNKYNNLAKKNK